MPAIHQLVAGFSRGDAISNEALVMRALFRAWGCRSDIFCDRHRVLPELRAEAHDLNELSSCCGPDDVAFLHLSIGSRANDLFPRLAGRKALLYHNITPPDYFSLIQPSTAADLARGRVQAAALAGVATVNLADSAYNAEELRSWGYPAAGVLPLMIDFDRIGAAPDRALLRRFGDGRVNILFVGRCAPNKKIEDCITAFAFYQKGVNPHSRLILAGSYAGTERYQRLLLSLVRDLKLEEVVFTGSLPQSQLNACYRSAQVFLCMSEHEGFCIPLVESLAHRVPVLAYASSAIPETLGGAGVLFREKRYEAVAEMLGKLAADSALREAVLIRQDQRLAEFKARDLATELRQQLAPLLVNG